MQRKLLALALIAACGSVMAADPTPRAATPQTAPMPHMSRPDSNPTPAAAPTAATEEEIEINIDDDDDAQQAPALAPGEAEEAHRELDRMRTQMRELAHKMAELSGKLGDVGPRAYAFRYMGDPDRAMIGIVMWPDEHGVRIAGLTPGGPAEKAGIKTNDVIVAIDGKAVDTGGKEKSGKSIGAATKALSGLKVGQDVKLTLLRDGKRSDVVVKAERREAFNWAHAMPGDMETPLPPGMDHDIQVEVHRALRETHPGHLDHAMRMIMPRYDVNLVSMNPDLGNYFGTDKGVLVVSIGKDFAPPLKSGDVVLEVAGQSVSRPEDAMRLVHDQPVGGEFKIKVLRQHKEQTLSMKTPEFRTPFIPEPPEPPQAPITPPPVHAPRTPPAPPPPPPAPPADHAGVDA